MLRLFAKLGSRRALRAIPILSLMSKNRCASPKKIDRLGRTRLPVLAGARIRATPPTAGFGMRARSAPTGTDGNAVRTPARARRSSAGEGLSHEHARRIPRREPARRPRGHAKAESAFRVSISPDAANPADVAGFARTVGAIVARNVLLSPVDTLALTRTAPEADVALGRKESSSTLSTPSNA